MRTWLVMLGGLLVWIAHFFALYGTAEFAGANAAARAAVAGFTALALGLVGALAYRSCRASRLGGMGSWTSHLGRGALLLAALAISWQALPALLS